MPPTHTPGALVLAFHFRCYTTDSNKRWELCDAPICAAATTTTTTTAKGKFSYTYLHRNVFYITYPAQQMLQQKPPQQHQHQNQVRSGERYYDIYEILKNIHICTWLAFGSHSIHLFVSNDMSSCSHCGLRLLFQIMIM